MTLSHMLPHESMRKALPYVRGCPCVTRDWHHPGMPHWQGWLLDGAEEVSLRGWDVGASTGTMVVVNGILSWPFSMTRE